MVSSERDGEGLRVLHRRLEAHFRALQAHRAECGHGAPIFVLEHGLSDAELTLLKAEVCSAVRRRQLPRQSWLPLVVYAAEIGYDYAGEDYWPTFEVRTPGWAEFGDRQYIRSTFREFSDLFGGAVPTGRWADWFSIISWPITHAVLPTDLQRQLARLLFEYRRALTSDLLADPSSLGSKLAARAWHYSSRFQNFAQNTSLLGQVAAALLTGDGEESPYLLNSTLRRIVESLSVEQEARSWLHDAKSSASLVRTHGFGRPAHGQSDRVSPAQRERLPTTTDPKVLLRKEPGGWAVYLDLPDLSELAERLPRIHEDLGRLRTRVAGRPQPIASGRLLFPGQQLRLAEWPGLQVPLIQIDGGSAAANHVLADQCVLSPGPEWLFRIRETGFATEVRSKLVHPGHDYILICRNVLDADGRPTWVAPTDCATVGVQAYSVQVPAPIGPEQVVVLQELGLGVQADISVRPAGLVPVNWDGEGAADWIAGEDAVVALTSTMTIAQCIFEVNNAPYLLRWPDGEDEIFVSISDLDVGTHEVRVSLLSPDVDAKVTTGTLLLTVRTPQSRPQSGTHREGLMLLASPAAPTLPELWDGRATVQILGPSDTDASVEVTLLDGKNIVLARHRFQLAIPTKPPAWRRAVTRQLRGSAELQRCYDDAESLVITASEPRLGVAHLRCEREFAPLRWVVGKDRGGPFVRLVDNTERGMTEIEHFEFAEPTQRTSVRATPGAKLRWTAGGLYRARVADFEVRIILPPYVRDLEDLRLADVSPVVANGPRTVDEAQRLIGIAQLWASASLPANPIAQHERNSVLRALTINLVGLIAGYRWSQLEEQARASTPPLAVMQKNVGGERYQQALAEAVCSRLAAWRSVAPEKRTSEFGAMLNAYVPRVELGRDNAQFAELLLRLASEPASLDDWPEDQVSSAVRLMLVAPVMMRAARFLVLAIHSTTTDDTGTIYRGWAWT